VRTEIHKIQNVDLSEKGVANQDSIVISQILCLDIEIVVSQIEEGGLS
jgi:hypothetical protein